MNKNETIQAIRDIVENYGSINVTDSGQSCPMLKRISLHEILVEVINEDDVDCTEYVNGNDVDEFSLEFDELQEESLDEILVICQTYALQQEKAFNLCKNTKVDWTKDEKH